MIASYNAEYQKLWESASKAAPTAEWLKDMKILEADTAKLDLENETRLKLQAGITGQA